MFFYNHTSMTWTSAYFYTAISSKSMGENTSLSDDGEQWRTESLQTEETPKLTENGQAIQVDIKSKKLLSRKFNSSKIPTSKGNENGEIGQPTQQFAKRKNLIIVSPGRGGSSFLGSFFYNNPHVMYWYEPLRSIVSLVSKEKEPMKYKETSIKVINAFLQCNFGNISGTTLSAFFRRMLHKNNKTKNREPPANTISSMHTPQFSKTLLSKACNNYSHTVMKILSLRVPYKTIEALKDLFQQKNQYDVKLVHLIRDPRAVINSRVKLKWMKDHLDPSFRENVQSKVCDPVLQNIRLGLFSPPPWLKNRFKVIRYEDLVANTVNATRELYRFAGFDWSANIDKWISILANNTQHGGAYSLYRNASAALDNWKKAPEPFIRAVEDVCSDLMDLLGYKKMTKSG